MMRSQRAINLVAPAATVFLIGLAACTGSKLGDVVPQGPPAAKASPVMPTSTITGTIRYVALGDSTGVGVGARNGGYVARLFKRIEPARRGSTITNLCISGATTRDVLSRQLERGIAADPNLVTLGIGINDIGHGLALEEFAENYDAILTRLKQGTKATIVVSNLPDISSAPRIPATMRSEYQQRIILFNQKLEEIAGRHGVIVFDVFSITHEQLAQHPEYFSADGFHPSDPGYELWAEHMWPTIARVIGIEAGSAQANQ
ncbi:MAG TPA: SGNH/GDSL hydrolase family protein [Pyrinomonadaceae bacterium]|nr:SGNH/GDSL hydrolase family protein [Pyrinomonadaceae bacterium]